MRNSNLVSSCRVTVITLLLDLGESDISNKSFRVFCMIIVSVEDRQAGREAHVTVECYHHDDVQ